jgi:hypothetical protein
MSRLGSRRLGNRRKASLRSVSAQDSVGSSRVQVGFEPGSSWVRGEVDTGSGVFVNP